MGCGAEYEGSEAPVSSVALGWLLVIIAQPWPWGWWQKGVPEEQPLLSPKEALRARGGTVRAMALFPFLLHFLKFRCKMSKFWESNVQNGESESLSHSVVSDSL